MDFVEAWNKIDIHRNKVGDKGLKRLYDMVVL